jgi:hypothetical protein
LGGDGNGDGNFVATTAIASLCSLVVLCKKRKERTTKKEGQIETKQKKIAVGGFLET